MYLIILGNILEHYLDFLSLNYDIITIQNLDMYVIFDSFRLSTNISWLPNNGPFNQ